MRADERSHARGRYAGLAAGAAGLLMVSALGACKPGVDISLDQNRFDRIVSVGAVSPAEVRAAGEDDLSPTLQFALLDQRLDVIEPGSDQIVGFVLELNQNFTVNNLFIEGQSRLFPSPDIPCGDLPVGSACPVAAYGSAGFTCQQVAENASDVDEPVCALLTQVNVDANVPIEYIESQETDVVLLAAAGSSLFGIDPCGSVRPAWRSDPTNERVRAYTSMATAMASGPSFKAIDFCTASYREAGTLNLIGDGAGTAVDCFGPVYQGRDTDPDLNTSVRGAIDDLSLAELNRGSNNYLEALDDLMEIYGALQRDRALHVVLFTDGALDEDDVDENDARGITYDSIIAAATAAGVTIHVQQLDNRPPQGRGVPAGNVEALYGLAAATGGTHNYVQDPGSLQGYATNLGRMVPSHYRARVNITQLAQLPIGAYKVEAILGATVNNINDSFPFSARGTVANSTTDTRFTVYSRGTCDPAATEGATSCQPGYVCNAGTCEADFSTLEDVFPSPIVTDENIIQCVEDIPLCVEDCAPNEECVVLDVANLPNDTRVTACFDAAVSE